MSKRTQLPRDLSMMPFSIAEARERGISTSRLRSDDLDRPFPGVRAVGLDTSVMENRCLAFAPRMGDGLMFSHATAAQLWGMPLPLSQAAGALHVTAAAPARAPRVSGIIGHTRTINVQPSLLRGLVVASPAETWADLAETLPLHDLVAVGEHVITGNPIRKRPPLASGAELSAAAERRRATPGSRVRRAALHLVTIGALSRPETLTRLLLVDSGVPYPLINPSIDDNRGMLLAVPDLAWPHYKVALEYEGDGHRSVKRFRSDIARIERLVDHGWLVIKVSADDLFDRPRELVERVIRRLVSRGWTPPDIRLPRNVIYER